MSGACSNKVLSSSVRALGLTRSKLLSRSVRLSWNPALPFGSSSTYARTLHSNAALRFRKVNDDVSRSDTDAGSRIHNEEQSKVGPQWDEGSMDALRTEELATMKITDLRAPHTGYVRMLSFNSPPNRNAISRKLLEELSSQIESIHAEKGQGGTRTLILASELPKAFCAGADLRERKQMTLQEVQEFLVSLRHTFSQIATLPIPTISAISGVALGGGLEIALCTNLRVLSPRSKVGLPETGLGIIPGGGGTYRLPALIGKSHALDLMLTHRIVSADEAFGLGICNRLVSIPEYDQDKIKHRLSHLHGDEFQRALSDEMDMLARDYTHGVAIRLAKELCNSGPLALKAVLQATRDGGGDAAESEAYETVLRTEDRNEALAAFAEKRKPKFKGR